MSTMQCWDERDGEMDTAPPPAEPERIDQLRRLLPLAAERLTEAAAALALLDDQLEEHLRVLDRIKLAEQRRTAAFTLTVAFEAAFKVFVEVDKLGLGQELEEWQLSDACEWLATAAAHAAEGLAEHLLWEKVAGLRARANSLRSWAAEIEAPCALEG